MPCRSQSTPSPGSSGNTNTKENTNIPGHLIVGERMRAEGCVSSSAPGAMHLMLKIKTSFEAPKVHILLVIGTPVRI